MPQIFLLSVFDTQIKKTFRIRTIFTIITGKKTSFGYQMISAKKFQVIAGGISKNKGLMGSK